MNFYTERILTLSNSEILVWKGTLMCSNNWFCIIQS